MNDTRNQILLAAYDLFIKKGYNEVSIQEITKSVGLTKGAVYYFFKNKEQLFQEVFDRIFFNEMHLNFSKFSQDSLYKFYHDYLDHHLIFAQKESEVSTISINFYAYMFDAMKNFPELVIRVRESFAQEKKAWIEVSEAARSNGEIETTLSNEQVADLFILTGDGFGMRGIILGNMPRQKEQLILLWDALYNSIKA
ncbi:MAG: TetR/AcrR family transcriptional regulator [Peptococcaceae bacterium]